MNVHVCLEPDETRRSEFKFSPRQTTLPLWMTLGSCEDGGRIRRDIENDSRRGKQREQKRKAKGKKINTELVMKHTHLSSHFLHFHFQMYSPFASLAPTQKKSSPLTLIFTLAPQCSCISSCYRWILLYLVCIHTHFHCNPRLRFKHLQLAMFTLRSWGLVKNQGWWPLLKPQRGARVGATGNDGRGVSGGAVSYVTCAWQQRAGCPALLV